MFNNHPVSWYYNVFNGNTEFNKFLPYGQRNIDLGNLNHSAVEHISKHLR